VVIYQATKAITETIAWAASWIVLVLLIQGDTSVWVTLFVLAFNVWSGIASGRALGELRRAADVTRRPRLDS
jgi:hypothetical protein